MEQIEVLVASSENGVLPFEGSEMMDLSNMAIDVDSQTASVHETLQVLDVRKLPSGSNAKVDAQIYLNSALSQSDPTEFELSVHALQGEQAADKKYGCGFFCVHYSRYGSKFLGKTWL